MGEKNLSVYLFIKSFDSFLIEPMDKFMNLLKNDEWKHVRSIVTTTFTTVKLKKVLLKKGYIFEFFMNHVLRVLICLFKDVASYVELHKKLRCIFERRSGKGWNNHSKNVAYSFNCFLN